MSGGNIEKKARKPYTTAADVKAAFFDFKAALARIGIDSSNINMTRNLDGDYVINGFGPKGLETGISTSTKAVETLRQYVTIIDIMSTLHHKPESGQSGSATPEEVAPAQKRRVTGK